MAYFWSSSHPSEAHSTCQTTATVDVFKNTLYFPCFDQLCHENDMEESYWKEDPYQPGVYKHACTWLFLGEIINDELALISFLRNKVFVQDRAGRDNINVSFYPEHGYFDFRQLKKGNTICVLFAEQHYFLDQTIGLRIERLDNVHVFPLGLDDLFSLSSTYAKCNNTKCWSCEKSASDVMKKKCGSCKVAYYCDKKCQAADWTRRHRLWCKAMPLFLFIAKADLSKYDVNTDEDYWFGAHSRI